MNKNERKVGEINWQARIDSVSGRIEFTEVVLRSLRTRHSQRCGYWIERHSWTWVKLTSRHFYWGWASYIPDWCRHRTLATERAGHVTKLGAVRSELAYIRAERRERGDVQPDWMLEDEIGEELTLGEIEQKLKTWIKRNQKKEIDK